MNKQGVDIFVKNHLYTDFLIFRILGIRIIKVWEEIFSAISVRSYLGYAWVDPRTDIFSIERDQEEKGENAVIDSS